MRDQHRKPEAAEAEHFEGMQHEQRERSRMVVAMVHAVHEPERRKILDVEPQEPTCLRFFKATLSRNHLGLLDRP